MDIASMASRATIVQWFPAFGVHASVRIEAHDGGLKDQSGAERTDGERRSLRYVHPWVATAGGLNGLHGSTIWRR